VRTVPVEVKAVTSRQDLREFIELPFRLHSSSPYWVPPLRLERRLFHSRRMNAWFKHAGAQEFIARLGDRVVGRISAQVDGNYDAKHGSGTGMFGFLEFEDDPTVADALVEAARGWLAERGRTRMIGPMDYTMNDECGLLIEGYEREPMFKQPWHPPYYQRLCEAIGLTKAVDLYMWELDISDREKILPIIFELSDQARTKHGIELRHMRRRDLSKDVMVFGEVYNAAWKDNWGFVPYNADDLKQIGVEMQLIFDKNWFMVAERGVETLGIAITVPDINQVLKLMNGRLLPLGWWRFLRKGKVITRVRVGFLGVKPEYQHTGTAAMFYVEHFEMATKTPQTWGEMGWILETNRAMNRGMQAMGGRIAKRYRVYESSCS
jgi:hypothetical protein